MFSAVAQTLRWSRGTSLGREVVPEVWRRRAMSSGVAMPPWAAVAPVGAVAKSKVPAGLSGSA